MWELLKQVPRGRVSLRSIPLLATGLFVAVLLCAGIAKPAYADDVYRTTDGGFTYQGTVFTNVVTIKPGDSRGLATAATGDVTAYENINDAKTKAAYLYFGKGVDPKTATTALYTTFDYTPPSTYSNQSPSPPQSLTISAAEPVVSSESAGGCNVPGVGWILCPVGDFLSTGVDWVYKVVMMFLDVQPMLQNGPIYDIWNAIRSLANIVFVIVFLIVIFSQVTSVGISTYGIRKILPRLVIAALLVNLSFIICSIGIDLSNVLGHAVYTFVHSFYESLGSSVAVEISWSDIATTVLAGGGAVGGAVALHLWFSVATAGSAGAVFFMLLGILISVGLAALTALVILFARQGLLIIFTIISPFAFVAMALPSTEKWFKKWQETFTTLLLMFPIFSFVFSGALLAGAAIIAGSGGNILLVILGKTVQVLPLAVTPLIIKMSSGVLGTVAQFTNNKNKGLVDRARNWTSSQAEHHRKKSLGSKDPLIKSSRTDRLGRAINRIGKMGPRGTAQMFSNIERRQKKEQEGFEDAAQARAQSTLKYRRAYQYAGDQKLYRETTDNLLKAGWDEARYSGKDWRGRTDHKLVERELANRASIVQANEQAGRIETMHNEITAQGPSSYRIDELHVTDAKVLASMKASAAIMRNSTEEIAFIGITKRLAEAQQKSSVTERLTADRALRESIGRIRGEEGAQLVHAIAVADEDKQYGEFVAARQQIMKHFKVTSQETTMIAKGLGSVERRDDQGNLLAKFDMDDKYTREAAIERSFEVGAYGDIVEIVESTGEGGVNYDYRSTVQESLIKSGKSKIAPFLNDKALDMILKGLYKGRATTEEQTVRRIAEGRLTVNDLSGAHANALDMFFSSGTDQPEWQDAQRRFFSTISDPQQRANAEYEFHANFATMRQTAIEVLRDPQIRQATSTESTNTIKRYLGIRADERLDSIDWDNDPRFI